MPFNIGPGELLLVLAIALLVIGPGRLPDVGAALGKSIREFRKASTEIQESVSIQPRPNELRGVSQPGQAAPPAAPAPAAGGDEPSQQA
jgi:TatA/E family protein of Tat protein translocase